MKQAYIVAGPESSGNRALARLLIDAGCLGSTEFDHPWMKEELPKDETPAVVIRSFPHGNAWPDIAGLFIVLRGRGYSVRVLVPVRAIMDVIRSQLVRHGHPSELAWANYQESYRRILAQIEAINAWYALVPYVVEATTAQRLELLSTIGLAVPGSEVEP